MIFRTFIATAFALMSAFQPVSAVATVPSGFQYIVTNADDELVFGKVLARSGDVSIMNVYIVDANGVGENGWTTGYNCADKTWQSSNGEWKTFVPGSIGEDLLEAACR